MKVETDTRTAFILGRGAALDVDELRSVASQGHEVLLISIGFPPTGWQRRAVDDAMELAADHTFFLDAVLVTDIGDLEGLLAGADEVRIIGSGRERRRFRRLMPTV